MLSVYFFSLKNASASVHLFTLATGLLLSEYLPKGISGTGDEFSSFFLFLPKNLSNMSSIYRSKVRAKLAIMKFWIGKVRNLFRNPNFQNPLPFLLFQNPYL